MSAPWTAPQLAALDGSEELEIAVRRADGTLRRWLPVWVVCADEQVFVRTWHRRDTGWFGAALRSRRARVRVPGVEADVVVDDVVDDVGEQARDAVDAAYRAKYAHFGADSVARMVTDDAVAATLRLRPE